MSKMKLTLQGALILYLVVAITILSQLINHRPESMGVSALIFTICLIGIYVFTQSDQLERELKAVKDKLVEQKATIDSAYGERNVHVALLARMYPSGIRATKIEGWDPEWQNCVYIDLPIGQISYHYHTREAHLFEGLPPYYKLWDGHEKQDVHNRLLGTGTLTGQIPTAWLDHWIAHKAVNDCESRAFVDNLNQDLTEYLGSRVFMKRHLEPDWTGEAARLRSELRERGETLIG